MLYQFETLDGSLFQIDIAKQRWARVSALLETPSLAAAENEIARHTEIESGELIPMGGGVYNLEGRQPLSEKSTKEDREKPGAGLSSVGLLCVPYEDHLLVYIKPNVQIKENSFKSNPIKTVKYEVLQEPVKTVEPAVTKA